MVKEERVVVLPKCKRCRIKPSSEEICEYCQKELKALDKEVHDHYFWGLDDSQSGESRFLIKIYHDCNNLEWLYGRNILIDLDGGERKIHGVVKNAECMKNPPYRSGDVVLVKLA